jgi:hypothetical protein
MMTASAISTTAYKIDIVPAIENAFGGVFRNWSTLVGLAWLPFVIVIVSQLIAFGISGGGFVGALLGGLLYLFGALVFGTVFVVRWHRFVLLGEAESDELFTASWRHFFFAAAKLTLMVAVGWVVLFYLALIPPRVVTAPLFGIVGGIALIVLAVRMSLILPAAAVDRPMTFRESWDRIAGNTWRYFACAGICWIPFALASVGLAAVGRTDGWIVWLVCQILVIGVLFIGWAIVAGLLSEVYRGIVGDPRRV